MKQPPTHAQKAAKLKAMNEEYTALINRLANGAVPITWESSDRNCPFMIGYKYSLELTEKIRSYSKVASV